jgi:hypothetical protein
MIRIHTLVFASGFRNINSIMGKCSNKWMDGLTLEDDMLPELTSRTGSSQLVWCGCHNCHDRSDSRPCRPSLVFPESTSVASNVW